MKFNKKGDEDDSTILSFIIKVLLAIMVAVTLYLMIRGIGNAFLPK